MPTGIFCGCLFFTVLVIALLLLAMFGSIVEMALPLFGVAVAGIWTLGAIAWAGIPLNMLTVVVPILQIAVGTAYCLYIYCEFRNCVPVCKDGPNCAGYRLFADGPVDRDCRGHHARRHRFADGDAHRGHPAI